MRKLNILTLSLLVAFSCTKTEIAVEYGKVALNIEQGASAFLAVKSQSKAFESIPDTYQITTTAFDGSTVTAGTGIYGGIKNGLTLPVGKEYTLKAHNCTETEAISQPNEWGQQRFAGSALFDVIAGQTTNLAFICEMANAKISVVYDPSFTAQFENYSVIAYAETAPERKLTFNSAAIFETPVAFFNVISTNPNLKIEITGTRKEGNTSSTFVQSISMEAKTWHKLTIKTTSTNGSASLNISVDNTLIEVSSNIQIDPYN